jgi:hypothetical protein
MPVAIAAAPLDELPIDLADVEPSGGRRCLLSISRERQVSDMGRADDRHPPTSDALTSMSGPGAYRNKIAADAGVVEKASATHKKSWSFRAHAMAHAPGMTP